MDAICNLRGQDRWMKAMPLAKEPLAQFELTFHGTARQPGAPQRASTDTYHKPMQVEVCWCCSMRNFCDGAVVTREASRTRMGPRLSFPAHTAAALPHLYAQVPNGAQV